MEVGLRILERRLAKGMTQQRLAADAGVSERALRMIEKGAYSPQIATLRRIASALGCDPGELVGTPPGLIELSDEQRELVAIAGALTPDRLRSLLETARVFHGAMTAAV